MSADRFKEIFQSDYEERIFSPGRVNLIGEHIDYCGGLVMPMAINKGTSAWLRRIDSPELQIYSERFDELCTVPLKPGNARGHWTDFVVGVASLLDLKSVCGAQIYLKDEIGGGGLSSSASFSLLIAHALYWVAEIPIESDQQRLELAKICQQVEHEYVGVQCGIMDQASIALGGILSLDCAELSFARLTNIPAEYAIVVMNTRHSRTLAGSKYNERVAEIKQIKKTLEVERPVSDLCEIDVSELDRLLPKLGEVHLEQRLRHVVTEQDRVIQAKSALQSGNYDLFGQLMNKSHDSLQQDYEVTGDALDLIVELSRSQAGCLGARMTGAGFGGCAIALVEANQIEAHNTFVKAQFAARTQTEPEVFAVKPSDATGIVYSSR